MRGRLLPKAAVLAAILSATFTAWAAAPAKGNDIPYFDFTKPAIASEWGGLHHIANSRVTAEGLELEINGNDPYLFGPARDYPEGKPLHLFLRLRSEQGGGGQIFYFRDHPREEQSVRFYVPPREMTEVRMALPPLGRGYRLRIDPPGDKGRVVLAAIRFEACAKLSTPEWPPFKAPAPGGRVAVASGGLELRDGTTNPWAFELRVNNRSMAFGHPAPRLAYVKGEKVVWIDLAAGRASVERPRNNQLIFATKCTDPDGGEWVVRCSFQGHSEGAIEWQTTVSCSQEREVVFLPLHLVLAGVNSFGTNKHQGLLAGLEYLENEASSSELDLIGPEARRRTPARHKLTFPLMAIEVGGQYVGLIWEDTVNYGALFDSPDRTFHSGGHLMGVLWPGSDGFNRVEGELMPNFPITLKRGQLLQSKAWLIGGAGQSVVPAVQKYTQLRGWPKLPNPGMDFAGYVRVCAKGWLDSKIREGNRYRHAFWPGFGAAVAPDAAMYELWAAEHIGDASRAAELRQAAAEALEGVNPGLFLHGGVGHVRTPAAALIFNHASICMDVAAREARNLLKRFQPDGTIPYRYSGNGPDYGKTHWAPDANGLTAQVVALLLENAAFSGDRELINQAVAKLGALDKFRNTVPRGAQTWEVPLHTPDILASGHLVKAYAMGYELTGDARWLEEARYWAWTGVPFVYLVNPTSREIGLYNTIAVLGATQWKAPVWIGQPVQWCGLVYADALYQLASLDPNGPWKQLADGITIGGIQHSWKEDDRERVGLLPDSFQLIQQLRTGPAINPGTVGVCVPRVYGQTPFYDFRALRPAKLFVHAPGEIVPGSCTETKASFMVRSWRKSPYSVLIHGLPRQPSLRLNGAAAALQTPHQYNAANGSLILQLSGSAQVEITF